MERSPETGPVTVRRLEDGDRRGIAAILRRIQVTSGKTYPPAYVEATDDAVTEWLEHYPMYLRLVAEDTGGRLLGHVAATRFPDTDPDLPAWFATHPEYGDDLAELVRLFVDPDVRREGVGKLLLDAAVAAIHAAGYRPSLCVLDTQSAARQLYRTALWDEVGEFVGVSGRVNYVFLGPARPSAVTR